MLMNETSTSKLSSDQGTNKPFGPEQESENPGVGAKHSDVLALGMTAAIVAFVGAIVVLTIPYAIFSAPLPPTVNRLGLSVEATQGVLFGRAWYLLVPSILFALWIGYRFYQWGCSITPVVSPDEIAVDAPNDQEPPTSAEIQP